MHFVDVRREMAERLETTWEQAGLILAVLAEVLHDGLRRDGEVKIKNIGTVWLQRKVFYRNFERGEDGGAPEKVHSRVVRLRPSEVLRKMARRLGVPPLPGDGGEGVVGQDEED